MRNLKVVAAMGLLLIPILCSGAKADAGISHHDLSLQTPHLKAAQEPAKDQVKENSKLAEFLGKWVGKWDDIFYVQFTISPWEKGKERVLVLYEWEEHRGEELEFEIRTGKIEGNILKFGNIDISLAKDDENKGLAYGHFPKPRTANLKREKVKE